MINVIQLIFFLSYAKISIKPASSNKNTFLDIDTCDIFKKIYIMVEVRHEDVPASVAL